MGSFGTLVESMEVLNEIQTETAIISKLENGVIRVEIKDDAHLEEHSLEENYNVYLSLLDAKDALFLIIVNDSATISTEGRQEYNRKTRKEIRRKDALVIRNPATMLLINSQVKFITPIIPTQAFLDERSALTWLLS